MMYEKNLQNKLDSLIKYTGRISLEIRPVYFWGILYMPTAPLFRIATSLSFLKWRRQACLLSKVSGLFPTPWHAHLLHALLHALLR